MAWGWSLGVASDLRVEGRGTLVRTKKRGWQSKQTEVKPERGTKGGVAILCAYTYFLFLLLFPLVFLFFRGMNVYE